MPGQVSALRPHNLRGPLESTKQPSHRTANQTRSIRSPALDAVARAFSTHFLLFSRVFPSLGFPRRDPSSFKLFDTNVARRRSLLPRALHAMILEAAQTLHTSSRQLASHLLSSCRPPPFDGPARAQPPTQSPSAFSRRRSRTQTKIRFSIARSASADQPLLSTPQGPRPPQPKTHSTTHPPASMHYAAPQHNAFGAHCTVGRHHRRPARTPSLADPGRLPNRESSASVYTTAAHSPTPTHPYVP